MLQYAYILKYLKITFLITLSFQKENIIVRCTYTASKLWKHVVYGIAVFLPKVQQATILNSLLYDSDSIYTLERDNLATRPT